MVFIHVVRLIVGFTWFVGVLWEEEALWGRWKKLEAGIVMECRGGNA